MTIGGHRFMDGGVRSVANIDLSAGCERVVVIAPTTAGLRRAERPSSQVRALSRASKDVRAAIVSPDSAARAAIGPNVLDPSHRAASAIAGRTQAAGEVQRVRAVWS
jgi:NTE family protein